MTSEISSSSPIVSLIPVAKSLDFSFLTNPLLPVHSSLGLSDSPPPDPHPCAHPDTEKTKEIQGTGQVTLPSALPGSETLTQVPWMDR